MHVCMYEYMCLSPLTCIYRNYQECVCAIKCVNAGQECVLSKSSKSTTRALPAIPPIIVSAPAVVELLELKTAGPGRDLPSRKAQCSMRMHDILSGLLLAKHINSQLRELYEARKLNSLQDFIRLCNTSCE